MTFNTIVKSACAGVLLAVLVSNPALAHHKPGHTANCHQHTLSPYCDDVGSDDVNVSAVPVPASLLMLGSAFGLTGAYAAYRRRKVKSCRSY